MVQKGVANLCIIQRQLICFYFEGSGRASLMQYLGGRFHIGITGWVYVTLRRRRIHGN